MTSNPANKLRESIREAVIIILSILLAFGIDASWDARRERIDERELLAALSQDFAANAMNAERILAGHERINRAFQRFVSLEPSEIAGLSGDDVDELGGSLVFPLTFDAIRGTLDAIIGSGSLGLIRDRTLRSDLTAFLNLVDDLQEDAAYVRETALTLWNAQVRLGGPWGVASIDAETLSNVRRDEELMGLARLHRDMRVSYLEEFEDLASAIDSIRARLPRTTDPS